MEGVSYSGLADNTDGQCPSQDGAILVYDFNSCSKEIVPLCSGQTPHLQF